MKKILFFLAAIVLAAISNAQVGSTAPNFTVTDIDGNEINLYEDILDQGYIAIIEISATWCGPCWAMHSSHTLETIHQTYGPNGTDQVRVLFYEGDPSTTMEDLQGNTAESWGDWLAGISFPMINESPLQLSMGVWAAAGYPTINIVHPETKEIVADVWPEIWNQINAPAFVNAVNALDAGATLDGTLVSVEELEANVDINVYPNPVENSATISLSGFTGAVTVQVVDMLGKEVSSILSTQDSEVIDFSELEAGNYIVRAFNDSAEVTKRVSVVK